MPRIARLDLRGFRGILGQKSLIFDGKSILLFGENGTGKSSFVDALEWLFTRRLTTLDGRAQELSSQKHGPHIRCSDSPLVSLTFSAPENVTIDSAGSSNGLSLPVHNYVTAAKENLFILRRSQLSRFIESQPRDRYALLRPFIPLGRTDEIEEALRKARDLTRDDLRQAQYRTDRLISDLRNRFSWSSDVAMPSEAEFISSVSKFLGPHDLPPIKHMQDIGDRIARVGAVLSEFGDLTRQSKLLSAMHALEQARLSTPLTEIDSALAAITELQEKETRETRIFFEGVLEQGAKWIEDEPRNDCPLCEQPIDPNRVVSRVRERLREMQVVVGLRKAARESTKRAEGAIRSALQSLKNAADALRVLGEFEENQVVDTLTGTLTELSRVMQQDFGQIDLRSTRPLVDSLRRIGEPDSALNALRAKLQEILRSLPSQEKAQGLLTLRQRLIDASRLWLEWQSSSKSQQVAVLTADVAERVYASCQAARKEVVQSLYDELSDDINAIYNRFHPDESHSGIHLEVREAVQGSAHLRGGFYDRLNEDVRAYYSDGHLDTLGLSIFLALRRWHRRAHPSFNLLVLDDVLTSVDSQHLIRVSEVLLREFSEYQILLTTHDRILFEHLRDIQSRCRVSNRFANKIIHKWTIEEGPDLREPQDERNDLQLRLGNGEPRDIAWTAGRLLEHVLQEMRYSFRLGIGAKRGELYEIGELWPAFYSEVRKNYPSLYQAARESLDALDVRWPLRNWIGAHFNEWAGRAAREASIDFGKAVAELFDHLFCAECRRFVEPSSTPLGQVACRCGSKLYPAPGKKGVPPSPRSELVAATCGALKDARLDTNVYFKLKQTEKGAEQ